MEEMNIVVSFDSKYMEYAKTTLISLAKSNSKHNINLYLLYSELTKEEVLDIESFLKKHSKRVKLIPIYINSEDYIKYQINSRFTVEAYYRLLIQSLLPQDAKRALWLDSDLIIRGSLWDLYNDDFEDNYAIASPDICMIVKEKAEIFKRLGLKKDTIYFNSGVILLNLEKIRKEISQSEYFDFIENNRDKLFSPDQDVLNVLFEGKVKCLKNFYGTYNRGVDINAVYGKKEEKVLKKNIKILHYMGASNKPTIVEFGNFMFDEYWKYGKYSYGMKTYLNMKIRNKIYRFKNRKKLIKKERGALTVQFRELSEPMEIVVSFDSNYKNLGETMLVSLLKNNKMNMNIYLFYTNLQKKEIKEVDELIKKYSKKAVFKPIYVDSKKYKKFFTTEQFPIEACYRLLIQKLLPKSVKRALWLDSDMIIRGSLKDFYYQDFEDNYAIAVQDISMIVDDYENLKRLGLPENGVYFNSGVLLLNLVEIRKKVPIQKYFECMIKNKEKILYPDQDTLNMVYLNKIKEECNVGYNDYTSAPYKMHNRQEKKNKSKAKIFHYLGPNNKPTKYEYNNFGFDEFWKYGKFVYGYKKYFNMKFRNKIYRLKDYFECKK